ncbi:MAG: SPOR domain-containing protein [Betaproteobacteria bacterium]|nr:SPOR domain-containing protein [Betaproteobacteria bacterium]
MRGLWIGLLLLLNGGVLLAGLGLGLWLSKPGPTPEFNADKIRLLESPQSAQETRTAPEVAAVAQAEAEAAARRACLSWTRLDADGLAAVQAHLDSRGVAAEREFRVDKPLGWWVYLPPLPDAEALRLALEEVSAKGIRDFAAVRGGRLANAVSLGAFPSLDKARAHAVALEAKGLRGLRYGPRLEAGPVRLLWEEKAGGTPAASLGQGWPQGLTPAVCEAPPG